MKTNFPNVLAAVEAREKHKVDLDSRDIWAIADAIRLDCRTQQSAARDTERKLVALSAELKRLGYKEYNTSYLRQMLNTADAFPRGRRQAGVLFTIHRVAGSPDFLDWVVEECGTDVSKRDVEKLRKRWRELEKQQRKKQYEEAKDEERRATTPDAKKKAKDKVEELRGMPEPSPTKITRPDAPSVAALRTMSDNLDLSSKSKGVVNELRDHLKTIDGMKNGVHPDFVEALDETYEEAEKVIKQIRQRLEKSRLKIFKTIEGGKAS